MSKVPVLLCAVLSILAAGVITVSAEHAMPKGKERGAAIAVESPAKCAICGMDRRMFAYSRGLVTFQDGAVIGTCSISCARESVDKNSGKGVKSIQVADYDGKQLLAAGSAVWVIGGSKQGVMTSVATWAFADRSGAERFVAKFGGRIAGYEEAWKAAAE